MEVADLSQLKVGMPEEVRYNRKRRDGWQKAVDKAITWVVRVDQDKVITFSPSCPHLGCAYDGDPAQMDFACPCHGSKFALDGRVAAGPAQRPLDRYDSKVESGKVFIGLQIQKIAS